MKIQKFIFQVFVDPYTEQSPDFKGQFISSPIVGSQIISGWFINPDGQRCFRSILRLGVNKEVVSEFLKSRGY